MPTQRNKIYFQISKPRACFSPKTYSYVNAVMHNRQGIQVYYALIFSIIGTPQAPMLRRVAYFGSFLFCLLSGNLVIHRYNQSGKGFPLFTAVFLRVLSPFAAKLIHISCTFSLIHKCMLDACNIHDMYMHVKHPKTPHVT